MYIPSRNLYTRKQSPSTKRCIQEQSMSTRNIFIVSNNSIRSQLLNSKTFKSTYKHKRLLFRPDSRHKTSAFKLRRPIFTSILNIKPNLLRNKSRLKQQNYTNRLKPRLLLFENPPRLILFPRIYTVFQLALLLVLYTQKIRIVIIVSILNTLLITNFSLLLILSRLNLSHRMY